MNPKSLRIFLAGFEILIAAAGLVQLAIGVLSLPFGIVLILSSLPALFFGLIGIFEMKALVKTKTDAGRIPVFRFSALASLTGLTALAASYDFSHASAGITHTYLSYFFNLFMFLPVFFEDFFSTRPYFTR